MKSSKHNGYRDFEWAVKLNRYSLDILGLWPENVQNTWQKLMSNFRVLISVLGLAICLLIPSIHSLTIIYGDNLLMLDNLQFSVPVTNCSLRIIVLWWKKEAIIPIMNMIARDWIKTKSDQETNIMIQKARIARTIIICSYCLMAIQWFFIVGLPVFGLTMRLTSNITDPGRPMPLQSHYIYDITKRPQYVLTFISQAIYVAIAIIGYSATDCLLSVMIFHVCGQLDILKHRLQYLDKYTNYHKVLKNCVAEHIRLLGAVNMIEDTYNIILFCLFGYFAILFAFYGFRLISLFDEGNNISFTRLIYFASSVTNIFVHMCLYCVLGEILMAQCNETYYAAYNNEWYTMETKVAEDLLILMTRGSKPTYLTVGKVCPITTSTFCSLVKTSIGYISVLHTMKR